MDDNGHDNRTDRQTAARAALTTLLSDGFLKEIEIDGKTAYVVKSGETSNSSPNDDINTKYSRKFFNNTLKDIVTEREKRKNRKREDYANPDKGGDASINRLTKVYGMRLRASLASQVDEKARQRGLTRQALVEAAVHTALKMHEAGNPHGLDEAVRFDIRLPQEVIDQADKAATDRGVTRRLWLESIINNLPEP